MKSKSQTTLTEERAAALAEMIEREDIEFGDPLPRDQWPTRGRGRPALSPSVRGKSPQLTIRVSAELRRLRPQVRLPPACRCQTLLAMPSRRTSLGHPW